MTLVRPTNTGQAALATSSTASTPPSTCFTCTRLNPTTFLIVEDDKWQEAPFIYVQVHSAALVVIDTGCGGAARDPAVELTSLRRFIEEYPVRDNDGRPLNPAGARRYVVVCTHCHYDHIGAIAQFTDARSSICASAHDRGFIEDDLPTTSLCRFVGMQTPVYTVTHWAADLASPTPRLAIYHTPGHTPDSLAVWDAAQRVLFVGDALYERAPIVFPREGGDLRAYTATLHRLQDLVAGWNAGGGGERVRVACGHVTSGADAAELVGEVERFLSRVRRGLVEPRDRGETRGCRLVAYEREDGRISFVGPKSLFDDYRVDECPV